MKEILTFMALLVFYHVKLSYSAGINQTRGESNFRVLTGDVDLGPLSEHPELLKVAAVQNEVVNVTESDGLQTAVVTVGVNIRLDWSGWVTEVLGTDSPLNTTSRYTYARSQLSESGRVMGPTEVLRPSERVAIRSNEELNLFYVEIECVVVTPESDSAVYELEACVSESEPCSRSEIIIYVIERPPPLRFELDCTVDQYTIHCEGVNGDIDESKIACIYDSRPKRERCELPVTIDLVRYDRDPGYHNITIITNSTRREAADYTYLFRIPDIECIQLTEPGRVTVICQIRSVLDMDMFPLCRFVVSSVTVNVPCNDIHNIVIVTSELPITISDSILPQNVSFMISAFDAEESHIILNVSLTEEQLVECSTTVDCSSNSTMMLARECCVNSEDGLSYSIPGQQCHTCIVFGWFQDSFAGIERKSPYNLSVGYLKGAEQVDSSAALILNVIMKSMRMSDITLETTRLQVQPDSNQTEFVVVTFVADEVTEDVNESLTLQLVSTPATLTAQTIPTGEGVFFKQEIDLTIIDADKSVSDDDPGFVDNALIGGVVGTVLILLIATIILLLIFYLYRRYHHTTKKSFKMTKPIHRELLEGGDGLHLSRVDSGEDRREIFVKSSFKLNLSPHLIIPSSSIKLNETIGQGEFGIVYKGYVKKGDSYSIEEYLAIKTLKGFYDHSMVRNMLEECSRMSTFDHINVLTLKGVCLDGGPAPYIIMPFMANGSLLAYLKKNRKSLVISSEDAGDEDVEKVRKQLMDMCIQIAKGMEYLASMKVVHRDLAARNCMIDSNFVIKIADFGLSESIGAKEYFHQDVNADIKLPLKWLPPESINDYIFSEKSDVWAYGVTCWEIFSGGKVPYAELRVREIPKLLAEGYRLEKPSNNACSEEMYSFMHQCWSEEPEHRPSFTQLVESLSNSLEGMAGYVHIGAFGIRTQNIDIH